MSTDDCPYRMEFLDKTRELKGNQRMSEFLEPPLITGWMRIYRIDRIDNSLNVKREVSRTRLLKKNGKKCFQQTLLLNSSWSFFKKYQISDIGKKYLPIQIPNPKGVLG